MSTNSNPNGSYTALYSFRELVDPVPSFSRFYSPSGASTELSYGQLIAGACVDPGSQFAQGMISDAQRIYDESALQNMGGTVMQQIRTGSEAVSFGPFALKGGVAAGFTAAIRGATVSSDALQVVGWISSLVPLTPKK
jgi:hypothetical protein